MYAIGGHDGSNYLSSVEKYDAAMDAWTPIASMGTKRAWFASAMLNGTIYAMGGRNGGNMLSSAEKYDTAMDTWTPIASMGVKRQGVAAAVLDGVIYAIGGRPDVSNYLSSAEKYDAATNLWTPIALMGTKRYGGAAAVLDGAIYAMGGRPDGSNYLSSVERYHPVSVIELSDQVNQMQKTIHQLQQALERLTAQPPPPEPTGSPGADTRTHVRHDCHNNTQIVPPDGKMVRIGQALISPTTGKVHSPQMQEMAEELAALRVANETNAAKIAALEQRIEKREECACTEE